MLDRVLTSRNIGRGVDWSEQGKTYLETGDNERREAWMKEHLEANFEVDLSKVLKRRGRSEL